MLYCCHLFKVAVFAQGSEDMHILPAAVACRGLVMSGATA